MCQVGDAWQKINQAIRLALTDITLADLGHPPRVFPPLNIERIVKAGKPAH
jgi:DNA-binding IscR family transcriptional regulator